MKPSHEILPEDKKRIEEAISLEYQDEYRQAFTDLSIGVSLCLAFQNRATMLGYATSSKSFEKAVQVMKDNFIAHWVKAIGKVKVGGLADSETGEKHDPVDFGIDIDEIRDSASEVVEGRIRLLLCMGMSAETLESMFKLPCVDPEGP